MVVDEITGVVKVLLEVAKAVPPDAAAYQSMVCPDCGVAVNVTVPGPQRLTKGAVGAEGNAFIVIVMAFLVAETQPVVVFLDCA